VGLLQTTSRVFSQLRGLTHQTPLAHAEFAAKKKITRREKFLARMEDLIPWAQLLAVLEPHYPKGQRGRPPVGLERMLRVFFLQQWRGWPTKRSKTPATTVRPARVLPAST
jgi:IS5 family transposase